MTSHILLPAARRRPPGHLLAAHPQRPAARRARLRRRHRLRRPRHGGRERRARHPRGRRPRARRRLRPALHRHRQHRRAARRDRGRARAPRSTAGRFRRRVADAAARVAALAAAAPAMPPPRAVERRRAVRLVRRRARDRRVRGTDAARSRLREPAHRARSCASRRSPTSRSARARGGRSRGGRRGPTGARLARRRRSSRSRPRATLDAGVAASSVLVGQGQSPARVGRAAIDALRAARPDVVVVDMGWPSPDRAYADVATFGASRFVGRALVDRSALQSQTALRR